MQFLRHSAIILIIIALCRLNWHYAVFKFNIFIDAINDNYIFTDKLLLFYFGSERNIN